MTFFDYSTYWGIFPLGILIATLAMSTGIDGAVFWAPVLLFLYKLDPITAIACGIFIEVFGFGSGVYGYAIKKKIRYREAFELMLFTIPFGLLGAFASKLLPGKVLISLIGISSIILIFNNIYRAKQKIKERSFDKLFLKNKPLGYFLSALGGFFTGTIGVGIGEANHYYLLMKNRYPVVWCSGTTVFMIAITAFVASVFNFFYFREGHAVHLIEIYNIVFFAIPGVLIGSRLGVLVAHRIKRKTFNYFISVIFTVIAILSFYRVLFT